ncbi:MAG TPA: nuclear transport factor 2 family protein [Pelobium sp.]
MKNFNLKKLALALVMTVASISFASAAKTDSGQTMDNCVSSYISLVKNGNISNFNKMFTDDVKFTISTNGKNITHNKAEEYYFVSKNKGVAQQCEVLSSVVMSTDSYTIVKVSQVYDSFTRENYVTLIKTGSDWKINAVSSEFK